MKKTFKVQLIYIIIFTIIASCKNNKYPTSNSEFKGIYKTCSLDSMIYLTQNEIKIIDSNENINKDCTNKPEFTEWYTSWPGSMHIYFNKKEFITSYNIKQKNDSKTITICVDNGTLEYDKKTKIMTLYSTKFYWTRKFKTEYLKSENSLVLKKIE
jgi:hypothetical protein